MSSYVSVCPRKHASLDGCNHCFSMHASCSFDISTAGPSRSPDGEAVMLREECSTLECVLEDRGVVAHECWFFCVPTFVETLSGLLSWLHAVLVCDGGKDGCAPPGGTCNCQCEWQWQRLSTTVTMCLSQWRWSALMCRTKPRKLVMSECNLVRKLLLQLLVPLHACCVLFVM